ncbi:oxygen-dependent coproporphyrinogen oxidase [Salisaeta longa]|uniref:oxygen-dependent coproporphyrinogen oxidase n=1 Tax=Salisaeta longa TaxID=503170 RepID=UPI0003B783B2|nr:oxygen-dependent coproporphyrinogen oxidase [Salisaeta longa]
MTDSFDRVDDLREEPRTDISMGHRMQRFVEALQLRITRRLEGLDPDGAFNVERWSHREGGGGITAVIEDGAVFEKGGVNTSAVRGELPARMAQAFEVEQQPFFATGLSLVIHPRSPHVPTVHANFRYFALGDDLMDPVDQWFGGGADLTPYYPHLEDAQHFHRVWKEVCDTHDDVADYDAFKTACDDYFYLQHRDEARGVGGIFYDYLRDDPEGTFFFSRAAGRRFLESYVPIVERRKDTPVTEAQRAYQEIRRGRYVEFNLVYDRGTKFGLETGGRTESILMSLPAHVQWRYDWAPAPDSPEAHAQWYFAARDWLQLTPDDVPPGTA